MTAHFPHTYEVDVTWTAGREGTLSAPPRPGIVGGPPPQFDGREDWWSPEHLLLGSIGLCFMTTFMALAETTRLPVNAFKAKAEGTLEKASGGLVFTGVKLRVMLAIDEEDRPMVQRLVETAKKYCIISNSLKMPLTVEVEAPAGTAGAVEGLWQ